MRKRFNEMEMLKHAIKRLIHRGKAVRERERPSRSWSRASSKQESPEDYRVRAAGRNDAVLSSLLEDYETAVDSLRRWQASRDPHAAERVVEYRTLVAEIEAEIHAALDRKAG